MQSSYKELSEYIEIFNFYSWILQLIKFYSFYFHIDFALLSSQNTGKTNQNKHLLAEIFSKPNQHFTCVSWVLIVNSRNSSKMQPFS